MSKNGKKGVGSVRLLSILTPNFRMFFAGKFGIFKGLNSGCISRRRPRFAFIASPIHYCSGRAIKARHNGTENTREFPPLFWVEKILFFLSLMQIFPCHFMFLVFGKATKFPLAYRYVFPVPYLGQMDQGTKSQWIGRGGGG